VEGGRWKVEGGRWKVEGGRWKVEGGRLEGMYGYKPLNYYLVIMFEDRW
jgi:hypothetical protein